MNEKQTINKKDIIDIGQLLWEKNLSNGVNGNISARGEAGSLFMTAHGTCLGLLQERDILSMSLNGEPTGGGKISTEKLMHTEIYKNFPDVEAVIHTHTPYINGYFLESKAFSSRIFESKILLGQVAALEQKTPSVTDAAPLIEALQKNNIVVLQNHGVVAVGKCFFDCFLLIQALEDAIKVEALSRLFSHKQGAGAMEQMESSSTSDDPIK